MSVGTARNSVMLTIDEDQCRACGKCQAKSVCRGKAIRVIDRGEPPFLDSTRCWGCMVCVPACPFEAIVRHGIAK